MLEGAMTYAGFTYMLDLFFGSTPAIQKNSRDSTLHYTDAPLEIEARGF